MIDWTIGKSVVKPVNGGKPKTKFGFITILLSGFIRLSIPPSSLIDSSTAALILSFCAIDTIAMVTLHQHLQSSQTDLHSRYCISIN